MVLKKPFYAIIAAMSFLLTSCYSDYVHLKYEMSHDPDPVYQHDDSSKIAFISTQKAYRRATGISAFPDGGQAKVIYEKTGLFIVDTKNKKLIHLMEISGTPYLYTDTKLAFIDDYVYYNCEIDTNKPIDSAEVFSLRNKYVKCFSINIKTKKIDQIDTAEFNALFQNNKFECSLSALGKELKKTPLAEFGLVIQNIYPKSDKAYIDETIYLKSDGQATRRAVIEQIISKLDKQQIKDLLNKMDEYKNSLKGFEKTKYETYSKETYDSIQDLL